MKKIVNFKDEAKKVAIEFGFTDNYIKAIFSTSQKNILTESDDDFIESFFINNRSIFEEIQNIQNYIFNDQKTVANFLRLSLKNSANAANSYLGKISTFLNTEKEKLKTLVKHNSIDLESLGEVLNLNMDFFKEFLEEFNPKTSFYDNLTDICKDVRQGGIDFSVSIFILQTPKDRKDQFYRLNLIDLLNNNPQIKNNIQKIVKRIGKNKTFEEIFSNMKKNQRIFNKIATIENVLKNAVTKAASAARVSIVWTSSAEEASAATVFSEAGAAMMFAETGVAAAAASAKAASPLQPWLNNNTAQQDEHSSSTKDLTMHLRNDIIEELAQSLREDAENAESKTPASNSSSQKSINLLPGDPNNVYNSKAPPRVILLKQKEEGDRKRLKTDSGAVK